MPPLALGMASPNIQVVKLAAQILVILDQNLYLVIAPKIKLRYLLQNAVQLATHAKQNTRIVIIARQDTPLLALTDIHQPPANVVLVVQHRVLVTNVMQAIPILIIAHQDIRPAAVAAVILKPELPAKNVLAEQHPEPAMNVPSKRIPTLTLARPVTQPLALTDIHQPPANVVLVVQHRVLVTNVMQAIPTLTLARPDIRPAAAAAVILKSEVPARNVLAGRHQALAISVKRDVFRRRQAARAQKEPASAISMRQPVMTDVVIRYTDADYTDL